MAAFTNVSNPRCKNLQLELELLNTDWPESFQRGVELHKRRRDGRAVQAYVVWRRHGHQALDSGEGHSAALCWAHQAATDAILAVVLSRCGKHTVGAEALHGRGHAVCGE